MSLTKKQQPGTSSLVTDRKIHGLYDTYYTAISTLYATNNMKYKFTTYIYDEGEINVSKNYPWSENYGVFNVSPILKNKIDYTFQPSIINWTPCGDIINYRVNVKENFLSVDDDSEDFTKANMIRVKDKNFNYTQYLLKKYDSKFLTDFNDDLKVTENSQHTIRCLNGCFYPVYSASYLSKASNLYIKFTLVNGRWYIYRIANGYYSSVYNGFNSTNTTLQDTKNWLMEIGVGPDNINRARKYLIESFAGSQNTLELGKIVGYDTAKGDVLNYQIWVQDGSTIVSETLNFEIICTTEEFSPITFAWENKYGATDYFLAEYYSSKGYSISKSTYYKYDKELVNGYVTDIENSGGHETFNVDWEKEYIANTNYITEFQSTQLAQMWLSENVYAQIGGVWYKIQLTDDELKIQDEKLMNVPQYAISFKLSKKKEY